MSQAEFIGLFRSNSTGKTLLASVFKPKVKPFAKSLVERRFIEIGCAPSNLTPGFRTVAEVGQFKLYVLYDNSLSTFTNALFLAAALPHGASERVAWNLISEAREEVKTHCNSDELEGGGKSLSQNQVLKEPFCRLMQADSGDKLEQAHDALNTVKGKMDENLASLGKNVQNLESLQAMGAALETNSKEYAGMAKKVKQETRAQLIWIVCSILLTSAGAVTLMIWLMGGFKSD